MSQHYDFYADLNLDSSLSAEELSVLIEARLAELPAPVATTPVVPASPEGAGATDGSEGSQPVATASAEAAEAQKTFDAAAESADVVALRDKLTTAKAVLGDASKRAQYDAALQRDDIPVIGPMELHRFVEKGYFYEKPAIAWEVRAAVVALAILVLGPFITGIRLIFELNDVYQEVQKMSAYGSNSVVYMLYDYSLMGMYLASIVAMFWFASVAGQGIYTLLTSKDPRARVPMVIKIVCAIAMILAMLVVQVTTESILIATCIIAVIAIILVALPKVTAWMQRVDPNEALKS
ncbi:MAG: hypothetical protein Q3962_05905 [Corynebacterium sp.]|nr:hypothetical protein [Corynebacterium sp.]